MNFDNFKRNLLLNQMIYFLDKNEPTKLWALMEHAIYLKSCYLYNQEPKNFSLKIVSTSVENLEKSCSAIRKLLKRTDLNHRERMALMFLYVPLGKGGEQRLWDILRNQKNFKHNLTFSQIESYKKKGKFYGISCDKLREWRICQNEC